VLVTTFLPRCNWIIKVFLAREPACCRGAWCPNAETGPAAPVVGRLKKTHARANIACLQAEPAPIKLFPNQSSLHERDIPHHRIPKFKLLLSFCRLFPGHKSRSEGGDVTAGPPPTGAFISFQGRFPFPSVSVPPSAPASPSSAVSCSASSRRVSNVDRANCRRSNRAAPAIDRAAQACGAESDSIRLDPETDVRRRAVSTNITRQA